MDDQKWTHVVSKRAFDPKKAAKFKSAGNRLRRDSALTNHERNHDESLKVDDIIRGLTPLTTSLKKSDFFKRVLVSMEITTDKEFATMVSLGIGNVLSSPSSLLQFALVLCLRETWQSVAAELSQSPDDYCNTPKMMMQESDMSNGLKFQIFDPLFSLKESVLCRSLGLFVSDENKKGKHKATNEPTLFFMPHCPYRLYVNLLWENWGNLENVIILGNSFQSYSLRRSSDDDKTDCISLLRPLVTEIPIWDDYCKELKGKKPDHCLPPELSHLENAFCDLRISIYVVGYDYVDKSIISLKQSYKYSVHYFSAKTLSSIKALEILAVRPGEAEIDEAAALDEELFS